MAISAIHWNRNQVCSVAIITTLDDIRKGDLLQICVLPLDSYYRPRKDVAPFDVTIKPRKIANIVDLHGVRFNVKIPRMIDALNNGLNYYQAAEAFQTWFFERLKPPKGKKIMTLGINLGWVQPFLREWLNNYDDLFHWKSRDLCSASLFVNDKNDFRQERISYPKSHLSFLASVVEVEYEWTCKEAIEDAKVAAECYERMLRKDY